MNKRIKYVSNTRNPTNLCPACFSTLILTEHGNYECSGDRLYLLQDDIASFKRMNKEEQQEYLNSLTDPNKFLDILNFECGYNNKIIPANAEFTTKIPDPIAVAKIEKLLKRKLHESELDEDKIFIIEGKKYNIPYIIFPDEG